MKSPIEALMQESGAPMTRDEYIRWNGLGKSAKISPEEEVELPRRFQYPVVSHEELPTGKTAKGTKAGASTSFGGPVLPNSKNLKPQLDTEPTKEKPVILPGGAVMDISAPSKPTMDTTNPPKADFLEDESTPEPTVPMRPSHNVTIREQ